MSDSDETSNHRCQRSVVSVTIETLIIYLPDCLHKLMIINNNNTDRQVLGICSQHVAELAAPASSH